MEGKSEKSSWIYWAVAGLLAGAGASYLYANRQESQVAAPSEAASNDTGSYGKPWKRHIGIDDIIIIRTDASWFCQKNPSDPRCEMKAAKKLIKRAQW